MSTKAKQTADQYSKLRSDLTSKTSSVAKTIDVKKKEIIAGLKSVEENSEIVKSYTHKAAVNIIKKFREENRTQIDEYKRLGKEHRENESLFQELFTKAKENGLTDLDLGEFRKAIGKEDETEKKLSYNHLINNPNMTSKDKEGMSKSIKFLETNDMLTIENIKKLEAINYASNYIEIGGIKRAREDIKAKLYKKTIFQHGDTTYFKWSEEMIKEQNKILAAQGMEIPLDNYFETSLQALPGDYKERGVRYTGGNILSFITNMSMSGSCDSDGRLYNDGGYGYRWSASSGDNHGARAFRFDEVECHLDWNDGSYAFPVRPVLK